MITTSAPNLDIIEVSASHNAGDACPSFSLTVKPHLGTTQAVTTHLGWAPPNPLTITVDGFKWDCVPLDVPIRISAQEVVYQVNYYPRLMYLLRRAKLKKPAVWVAAPIWEQTLYLKDIDRDTYQIFTKDADVYASNGFTVQDILQTLSGLCGFQFLPNFPELHVSQKSLMCDENTPILDFVGSLLPSGFRFVWDMRSDGVTISLLSPPIGTTITPPEATSIEQITPPVETYDSVSITGAPYKLSPGLSLGGELKNSQPVVAAPGLTRETLPEETGELDGQPTRTTTTRTVQLDPYQSPFAVLTEQVTTYVKTTIDRRTTTETTFENLDCVVYETPRVVTTVKRTSGNATSLSKAIILAAGVYYLTSSFQIMSSAEYNYANPKPSIILSAYPTWKENMEVVEDRKTYTPPEQASKVWPEGCELSNVQTTTVKGYAVNGKFISSAGTPSSVLQSVGSLLQQSNATAVSTLGAETKQVSRSVRTLRQQGHGAYRFEETRQTLDASGVMQTTQAMIPVNSDPPASPTRWRTAPLTAVLDRTSAAGNLVFRLTATVPTSNPHDFEVWAKRLFYDATHPRRVYSLSTTFLVPQGFLLGGGMVTAWSASQKGNVFSATLTIE